MLVLSFSVALTIGLSISIMAYSLSGQPGELNRHPHDLFRTVTAAVFILHTSALLNQHVSVFHQSETSLQLVQMQSAQASGLLLFILSDYAPLLK